MQITAALLAHEGGWDEILLVAAPLVTVGGVLWFANRWAKKRTQDVDE